MKPTLRPIILVLLGALVLLAAVVALRALSPRLPRAPAAASSSALTVTDDVGRHVTLTLPIRRTVVFNSFTTEFIRAVAGMDVVVGVEAGAAKQPGYWPTVTPAMIVGQGQSSPNYEAIVALKPDLVFFPRNGDWKRAESVLAPFHIPVVVLTGWDSLKHEANVEQIGRIYGHPERADRLNAFDRRYRDILRARLEGVPRRRVYLEQATGPYQSPIPGSGWHDMVELGGGDNIFGDVVFADQSAARGTVHAYEIDPEQVLARKPDLIVKLEPFQYVPVPDATAAAMLRSIVQRPGYDKLPAVRTGQVYYLSNMMGNASSKILGAMQIAKWLYPDRFADIDPSEGMREWMETFQGVGYQGHDWVSLGQVEAMPPQR